MPMKTYAATARTGTRAAPQNTGRRQLAGPSFAMIANARAIPSAAMRRLGNGLHDTSHAKRWRQQNHPHIDRARNLCIIAIPTPTPSRPPFLQAAHSHEEVTTRRPSPLSLPALPDYERRLEKWTTLQLSRRTSQSDGQHCNLARYDNYAKGKILFSLSCFPR